MVHALTALLFPLAILAALGTIGWMLMTYGNKMISALRMEHGPTGTSHVVPTPPITYRSTRNARGTRKQVRGYVPTPLARAA